MQDLQLIENKVLSRNLPQLTLADIPCFESTEDCAQKCFKNEWFYNNNLCMKRFENISI